MIIMLAGRSFGLHHSAAKPVVSQARLGAPQLCRVPIRPVVCQAAASDDPFQVLGIKPDADQQEITRAYNRKRYEHRNNTSMIQKVEAAHGQLVLSAFNARLQGGKTIPKSIKYADREPLFPWRPKRWDATPKIVMIFGALQLGMLAFSMQAPNVSKAMACMLIGIAGNVMKQNAIFPPPEDPDMATEEESGRAGRNFVRGVILGLMATFSGILLFSFPEYVQQIFNITLPVPPSAIVTLKVAGSAIFNWVMTAFYY
uniref:J domain-containing protein n=1 Tax=Chlamydomonas leiostraca TaxID=1034604 RepID=A0A7S0RPY0_9CHLO